MYQTAFEVYHIGLNSYRNSNHSFQTRIFSAPYIAVKRIQLIRVHVSDEIIGKDIWRAINTNSAIKRIEYGTWCSSLVNGRSQFIYILCPGVQNWNKLQKARGLSHRLLYPYEEFVRCSSANDEKAITIRKWDACNFLFNLLNEKPIYSMCYEATEM
jgi:hypothetical protein